MDVSIKKAQDRELKFTQEVMGRMLSGLPYFIFLVDSAGKLKYANQAAAEIFGQNNSTIIQKPLTELITGSNGKSQLVGIRKAVEAKGRWDGEILVTRPDGKQIVLELAVARIASEKNTIYQYSGRDVTEQRYRQRQSCTFEKLAARGAMAGEISHEINNYLSIIMGNLELLGMGLAKGKIDSLAPRIKSMREGLTRMTKFVEGLMSIAKPEAKYEPTDLRRFIEKEVFFLKQDPHYKGIEFIYHWDEDIPLIEVVSHPLKQALANIFSNACDALETVSTGRKRIIIEGNYSAEDEFVKISVSDNGCGMSEENYQKAFRQFFTTKGPGHGFGLLAVKGGIKSQGGRVSAAPSTDGGACFTIELPLRNASPTAKITTVPE